MLIGSRAEVYHTEDGEVPYENQAYFKYRKKHINIEAEVSKKTIMEQAYKSMINKFSTTFDQQLKQFMNAIKASHYEPHIANLLMRLDFNNYYEQNLLSKFERIVPGEGGNMDMRD